MGDAAYPQRATGGPSHGHRHHAQKIGKDREGGSGDILSDRQTHRQTERHSSQYFATAPEGEVIILFTVLVDVDIKICLERQQHKVAVILSAALKLTETTGYATWFTAGGAIRIAHYDVITRKL